MVILGLDEPPAADVCGRKLRRGADRPQRREQERAIWTCQAPLLPTLAGLRGRVQQRSNFPACISAYPRAEIYTVVCAYLYTYTCIHKHRHIYIYIRIYTHSQNYLTADVIQYPTCSCIHEFIRMITCICIYK